MNTQPIIEQPHDWWNTLALGVAALAVVIVLMGLSGCSTLSPTAANANRTVSTTNNGTPANTAGEIPPKSLADAGEYGENIYDFAKANDWKRTDVKLASLKNAATKVRTDVKSQSKAKAKDELDASVSALERTVAAKDRQATMREANQVTLEVADMTTAYKLTVPVEVVKLDYYGRELEIWAEAKDTNKLQTTARAMRKTWDALRPSIEAHSPAEAGKFGDLIAQTEAAKTPSDYARLAKPVLDEVDNLEKLFHK